MEDVAYKPIRLDVKTYQEFDLPSRSVATQLIKAGNVTINGEIIKSSSTLVKEKDKITLKQDKAKPEQAKIEIPIIYEDDDCLVIDKPLGLLTHAKGNYLDEATIASWLSDKISPDIRGSNRDGIVHRLDRATSGVMIAAKTKESMSWLQKQFAQRRVKKAYIAVIMGTLDPAAAIIDMPIERNPKSPQKFRVGANGKPAVTEYSIKTKIILGDKELSVVELKPTTGRTHQLRVHLAELGHPIVGDTFYNGKPADRLYLHALSLELTLPSRKRMTFSVKLPNNFESPGLL